MKLKEKTVFAVSVKTKHFLADFFQWFKNLIGMNLTAYEQMIEDSIEEAIYKLLKKYGLHPSDNHGERIPSAGSPNEKR